MRPPPSAHYVTFFMRRYKHNFWQARFATSPRVSSPHFICMHASLLRLVLRDSVRYTTISAGSTTCISPHYGFNFGCIKRQGFFSGSWKLRRMQSTCVCEVYSIARYLNRNFVTLIQRAKKIQIIQVNVNRC